MTTDDGGRHRRALVDKLEAAGVIRSAAVREAMLQIPRERFVPEIVARLSLSAIYQDDALVTKVDAHGRAISSVSAPGIVAGMLEELDVRIGMNVLEIGTGTGYNAALLAALAGPAGNVTSVEIDAHLAEIAADCLRVHGHDVDVVTADGRQGCSTSAPYDRIIVTASTPVVPWSWHDQLKDGGRLVMPLWLTSDGATQVVVAFEKKRSGWESTGCIPAMFMGLRGMDDPTPAPVVLSAEERHGESDVTCLAQLSGVGLQRVVDYGRKKLLAQLLTDGQRFPLTAEIDASQPLTIGGFVGCAVDRSWCVCYSLPGMEPVLAAPDGTGLAILRRDNGRFTAIESFGAVDAANLMTELIAEWRSLGCPAFNQLRIRIDQADKTGDDRTWRKLRRSGCVVSLDWRTSTHGESSGH